MEKNELCEFYSQYSKYTDPGELIKYYSIFPNDIPSIFSILKKLIIHRFDVFRTGVSFSRPSLGEHYHLRTVKQILRKISIKYPLSAYNDRKIEDRVVLFCYHHALLFSSILTSKGIINRVRAGFGNYLSPKPDKWSIHWLCEVYNNQQQRWIYIDPDRQLEMVSQDSFLTGAEVWHGLRTKKFQIYLFRNSWKGVIQQLLNDLNCIMHQEFLNMEWDDPKCIELPRLYHAINEKFTPKLKIEYNNIAEMLLDVDHNFNKIYDYYYSIFLKDVVL